MNIGRIAILAVVLAFVAGTCRADLIIFDASGTFQGGTALGGTVTIDTTVGDIISANLTASSLDNPTFSGILNQGELISPPGLYFAQVDAEPFPFTTLFLAIIGDSLVNYAGGPLASLGAGQ